MRKWFISRTSPTEIVDLNVVINAYCYNSKRNFAIGLITNIPERIIYLNYDSENIRDIDFRDIMDRVQTKG